jgi:hypothetical protein
MAVHGFDSGQSARGLDPMREDGGTAYAAGRIFRVFPKKGWGPWWNWYIDRKRIPLPHRNHKQADQYMRRNSWRRPI